MGDDQDDPPPDPTRSIRYYGPFFHSPYWTEVVAGKITELEDLLRTEAGEHD